MRVIGRVKAILSETMLLVSSQEEPRPNQILNVFASVREDRLQEISGLEKVLIPKGEIKIVCEQGEGLFLAETFREVGERRKTIRSPGPLEKSWMGFAAALQGETKEVIETVEGPPSAELDSAESLKLEFSKTVNVGDLVGAI